MTRARLIRTERKGLYVHLSHVWQILNGGCKSHQRGTHPRKHGLIKQNGGEFKGGYALLGDIDLVLIVDLPDTEHAMKTSAALSNLLGISFSTAPAVSVEDFDKFMG